ncbi:hypothetical protein IPJ91_02505 [bacterium]|nr:MAG: hypothetical protein IPJ91_02505 [bacterium]
MKLFTWQSTTQEHLDIEDIKQDLILCKNGQVSLVIETTAVNFDLLSEKEQEAKILAFAALINSLNFYIQILIRTEKLDVTRYIDRLEREREKQITDGLRKQIEIYTNFIKNLAYNTEVLDKRFFIVVSSLVSNVKKTSPIKTALGKEEKITNADQVIDKARGILYPRRDHLVKQMQKMNIFGRQLNTDELIKLFYSIYNPDTPGLQKLQIKADEIATPIITAK